MGVASMESLFNPIFQLLPALPDQESGSVQLVLSGVCLLIVFFFLLASGWPDAGAVTEITTVEQK